MLTALIKRLLAGKKAPVRLSVYQTGGYERLRAGSCLQRHERLLFGTIAYGNRWGKPLAVAEQCQAIWPFKTQLSITHIAVLDPAQTKQGIGTKFVEALKEHAKENGFTEILFEEPKANEAYRAFFEKIGAIRSEVRDQIGWIWKL